MIAEHDRHDCTASADGCYVCEMQKHALLQYPQSYVLKSMLSVWFRVHLAAGT
jgi:hypothetical protein